MIPVFLLSESKPEHKAGNKAWTLRLWGMWELDLLKIPRPQRSGLISVMLHLIFVAGLFTASSVADINFRCLFNPSCTSGAYTSQYTEHHRKIMLVFPGKGKGPKRKECTCHLDWHFYGGTIIHEDTLLEGYVELCDDGNSTQIGHWPREWTRIIYKKGDWSIIIGYNEEDKISKENPLKPNEAEVRMFCGVDDSKETRP
jgi:hypothetical protein